MVSVVGADRRALLTQEPRKTQVGLDLGQWRHDARSGVLLAQRFLHATCQVFIPVVGIVGRCQCGFEVAPVCRVNRVARAHVEQVDPHGADVGRLSDDLDDLLGVGITDHPWCAAAGVGSQPGIGSIARGRAGCAVVGGRRGTNARQHLLELQTYCVIRAQCADSVHILDGLVIQTHAQRIIRLPGETDVLDGGGFRLQRGVARAAGGSAIQNAAGNGVCAEEDFAAAFIGIEGACRCGSRCQEAFAP